MTHYKAFRKDGRTLHSRDPWPLPVGSEPGAWVEAEGDLVPCENGLHVMREQDLPYWPGTTLFEVEIGDEFIEAGDKVVCRRARLIRKVETWDHRTLVAWACDCGERTLLAFEQKYPESKEPREAIEVTRAWLAGKVDLEQVGVAVDAVDTAFHTTYVAWSVINAANTAYDVSAAIWAATYAATWATYDAFTAVAADAADAAYAAERAWQVKRMLEYIRGEVTPCNFPEEQERQ